MKTIKPKKCKVCIQEFIPFQTLQIVCGWQCAQVIGKKVEKNKKDKDHNNRKAEFYLNDIPHQHKLTQKAFNRMRVLKELKWFHDKNMTPECISCGGFLRGDQWSCGHLKTVGSNGALRYDETNSYLQHNNRCNMNLSGDIEGTKTTRGYKKGLLERFGEIEGKRIIDYCETNTAPRKWTGPQLSEMRKMFNAEIRRLDHLYSPL